MQVKDKLVVVTGAGKGIGRAMAQTFASRGANLALIDLNESDLEQTRSLCEAAGVKASNYLCNVAIEPEVVDAFDRIAKDYGRLDVLINNAGIVRDALLIKEERGQFKKMSLAQWQAVMDVNLTGVFLCGREAAERMIRFNNGGVIINMSSVTRSGNIGQSNYAASKAGVASMTVVWAKELARYGIRTGAIAPGFVLTEILSSMRPEILDRMLMSVPMRRGGQPEEIAQAAVFIVENDYFSGRIIELDGGLRL